MNRKAVKTLLAEESRLNLQEALTSQLVERISELGKTVGGLARAVGMDDTTLRRALFERHTKGMSVIVLERLCEELKLEVRLVPKGRK